MRTDECVLFAKVAAENGSPVEEIYDDIHLIDDMLKIMKLRSIARVMSKTASGRIRKDHNLTTLLSNRIQAHIDEKNAESDEL